MRILAYDGSFVGFLTAVFRLYAEFAYAKSTADQFIPDCPLAIFR